jgi:hypothetical protein
MHPVPDSCATGCDARPIPLHQRCVHFYKSRPTITLDPATPFDCGSGHKELRVTAMSYGLPFHAPFLRDT